MTGTLPLGEARIVMRDDVLSHWFAHYPEDVFPPLSVEQVAKAVEAIQSTGITSDALHAAWARHLLFHVMAEIKRRDDELLSEAP